MKKSLLTLLAGVALLALSCQKDPDFTPGDPGMAAWQQSGTRTATQVANQTPYYWANLSVQNTLPANNVYAHGVGLLTWAGVNGATMYACSTDCSGMLNHLLTQTYGYTSTDYQTWMGATRPLAEDYYAAINTQNRFTKIPKVSSMQRGDIIAIQYPAGSESTGHTMLIVDPPTVRTATAPLVSGTTQYEVRIIDCSASYHGSLDTRYLASGTAGEGIGQGIFRLYTNNKGNVLGYTWSTYSNSVYYTQAQRQLVVGRLVP